MSSARSHINIGGTSSTWHCRGGDPDGDPPRTYEVSGGGRGGGRGRIKAPTDPDNSDYVMVIKNDDGTGNNGNIDGDAQQHGHNLYHSTNALQLATIDTDSSPQPGTDPIPELLAGTDGPAIAHLVDTASTCTTPRFGANLAFLLSLGGIHDNVTLQASGGGRGRGGRSPTAARC